MKLPWSIVRRRSSAYKKRHGHAAPPCPVCMVVSTTTSIATRKSNHVVTRGRHTLCRSSNNNDNTNTKDRVTENGVPYNDQFGYSRKDIILIGVGLIGTGFLLNWVLQSVFQMDPIMAGNYAQLIIFVGLCVGWIGSYLFRVATKQMTYAKQLEEYEEAVMQKRLEELPESELENIMERIEQEEEEKKRRRQGE